MIQKMRNALDTKQISTIELLEEYKKRIKANKEFNCFITNDFEYSKELAKSAQVLIDERKSNPMTGILVAVKDNILTKDIKTTCASKMLENFIPDFDATVIKKLKSNGYILSGKTNMDEFAMGNTNESSYFGNVLNPHDKTKTPGGSSGGSAACVALDLSPVALGSDTGGSVRQPASFCGVLGLKPTYGKISRYGLVSFASSLEQIGIFAKTVNDIKIVLNTISGKDTHDFTSIASQSCEFKPVNGKIGLIKEFFDFSDEKISRTVENAAKSFEQLGFSVKYCSLKNLEFAVSSYYIISSAEASSNLSRFDGIKYGFREKGCSFEDIISSSRTKGFGKEVKRRILLGNYVLTQGYYEKFYLKAKSVQTALKYDFDKLLSEFDFLITPTVPSLPPSLGKSVSPSECYNADILNVYANLTGLPSLSVPCGTVCNMPVGMSITGKAFSESEILSLTRLYERSFGI